jgi:hypothetical protein
MEVVNQPFGIPPKFELILPGDGVSQLCRVAWRRDHRIGVAFVFPT